MTLFHDWLDRVLTDGESVLDDPPGSPSGPRTVSLLRAALADHSLDVAGPPLSLDEPSAVGAALALARACWLAAGGEGDPEAIGGPARPTTAAAHLSADVTFRFLPAVYRRAKARDPGGPLAAAVERLLRRWPLSGALADLDGEPESAPNFDGHPGLQLLYAERLRPGRDGWLPPPGPGREWVELAARPGDRP